MTLRRLVALALLCACASLASAQSRPAPRRHPLTPELERTAFADSTARIILQRARAARLSQDSALRAYDAMTYLRLSVGMGVRIAPEKLLMRTEQAARVRWARGSGVWVEPTARRTGVPMGSGDVDMSFATPIPYFPGRESLWIPSSDMGVVHPEVNENEFIHPLATGAEAYYRYESGGTVRITLPDGRAITLRELRITARHPAWNAFVGSFWFDVASGSLARAAYRMSAETDFWQTTNEGMRRQLADAEGRAKTDTGAAAAAARKEVEQLKPNFLQKLGIKTLEGVFTPATANLSAVTVEYGLYEGRFWLPKLNVAEGEVRMGFLRFPLRWQERFNYDGVNGTDSLPPTPLAGDSILSAEDTMYVTGGSINIGGDASTRHRPAADAAALRVQEDSLMHVHSLLADSLQHIADSLRAGGADTAAVNALVRRVARNRAMARQIERRREGCANDSTYYAGTASRYNGALRTAIRLPCDLSKLERSSDLPGSIYGNGEELFGTSDRDALLESLDLDLQAGWGPQWPTWHTGADLIRYNRVEGLSVGLSATSSLGFGYTARAAGRIATADHTPDGELSLARSNGRAMLAGTVFRRLGVANDDWGQPLSFSASLSNLLYGRDEGFYYRTWGAALTGTRDASGPWSGTTLSWRAFAERQSSAGVVPNTQGSLAHAFNGTRFGDNIDATPLTALGASIGLSRTFGHDPRRLRLFARTRLEGAFTQLADSTGASGYGRLVLDATATHSIGMFDASLTGAAGASAGDVPIQRAFFMGGLQTVRGQYARLTGDGRVGDAFWLGRLEVGPRSPALRPLIFYDIGWAGRRAEFTHESPPLQSIGAGLSLIDGLLRIDAARGLWPERRWRFGVYLGSRF